jgi:hypothetical protein
MPKSPLSESLILCWADEHHARTGQWPKVSSGPVQAAPGENWRSLNSALHVGCRGLPGGDSLARLLVRSGRQRAYRAGAGREPWTAAEDQLVCRLPPTEAARQTGRTLRAVYARRNKLMLHSLDIPDPARCGR